MADRRVPEWAAKRARGNRIIGLILAALVIGYAALFVARYVIR